MKMVALPGLVDMHVHLRDPGQTHKEDFYTGSTAAVAGGFTTVVDMPNNREPITTSSRLKLKVKSAQSKIVCDVGFYAGVVESFENLKGLERLAHDTWGVKLYLNPTTGDYLINIHILENVFKHWPKNKLILVHAEEDVIQAVINAVKKYKRRVHVCHVSSKNELATILKAKKARFPVTCGVTPHHLFLTERDVKTLGPYAMMKPSLKSQKDQDFLWKNLKYIDVIESDHAPHTKKEKESPPAGGPVPFGVPGLETTLSLLLSDKRISIDDILRLCHTNPCKILGLKPDKETKVITDENSKFEIRNSKLHTKCGWSPFHGWKVRGKVQEVYIRGKKVLENGKILAKKGSGRILNP